MLIWPTRRVIGDPSDHRFPKESASGFTSVLVFRQKSANALPPGAEIRRF
jgi:hypothetical protein